MRRRHHYRRRAEQPTELDVTTFMNLMVVLVPFLLITAVFSRIAIVELNLPSSDSSSSSDAPAFRLEVVVRQEGLELTNGQMVIAAIPNVDGEYDLSTLGDYMLSLKKEYPDSNSASVLLEPDIPYDYLIQVMDVVRSAEIPPGLEDTEQARELLALTDAEEASSFGEDDGKPLPVELFSQISIGAAP